LSDHTPPLKQNDLLFWATNYLLAALAAATILSKRGSPRKESQHGLKRRSRETLESLP